MKQQKTNNFNHFQWLSEKQLKIVNTCRVCCHDAVGRPRRRCHSAARLVHRGVTPRPPCSSYGESWRSTRKPDSERMLSGGSGSVLYFSHDHCHHGLVTSHWHRHGATVPRAGPHPGRGTVTMTDAHCHRGTAGGGRGKVFRNSIQFQNFR